VNAELVKSSIFEGFEGARFGFFQWNLPTSLFWWKLKDLSILFTFREVKLPIGSMQNLRKDYSCALNQASFKIEVLFLFPKSKTWTTSLVFYFWTMFLKVSWYRLEFGSSFWRFCRGHIYWANSSLEWGANIVNKSGRVKRRDKYTTISSLQAGKTKATKLYRSK